MSHLSGKKYCSCWFSPPLNLLSKIHVLVYFSIYYCRPNFLSHII